MSDYSPSDLAQLWIQAGGPSSIATLMGAIGFAESSGNPSAINRDSGACGLWQIHPPEPGCSDPFTNAQIAVRKYNSQGLTAWEVYTNGAYKQYYNGKTQQLSAISTDCMTFKWTFPSIRLPGNIGPRYDTGSICFDNIIGLGTVVFGIAVIAIGLAFMAISTPAGKQVIKTSEQVAITVAK